MTITGSSPENNPRNSMSNYPLYDIPYLVRDPNIFYMSEQRHKIEVQNQAIVDDYFIERDKGLNHRRACLEVAKKHQITTAEVQHARIWFYQEARRRKKYNFLEKFPFR